MEPQRIAKEIIQQAQKDKKKELNLSYLELTEIPDEVFSMEYLEALYIRGNEIKYVPEEISRLKNLKDLDLSKNKIEAFPLGILGLQNLKILEFDENGLTAIPQEIDKLKSLEGLFLNLNKIDKLPSSISNIQRLVQFEAAENQIKIVPGEIVLNLELNSFRIDDNPLESPPPEIAKQGMVPMINYFEELKEQGLDYIFEAKLLIVGEGGAGKTTLAKKIKAPDYDLGNEDTTWGIEVSDWKFKFDHPQSRNKEFKVNIWDFGGQEIYHSTHQFFLTKRSIYALVSDTRKEDTDFNYWLNTIELLSNKSPVVVVLNEKQNRKKKLNETKLRGQFGNLKAMLPCNLADNRGLTEVKQEIAFHLQKLPHIGTALPRKWVDIRKDLEKDKRNYISQNEYFRICAQNGIEEEEDALSISEYLHDLGVFLHFYEHPILKNVVILKPEWGTNAVYKLIDSPHLANSNGHLHKEEIKEIWQETEYKRMHIELLALMEKFELCYPLENNKGYIIPELLSPNTPPYDWDETDNIHFRFKYGFMPKGIITRFINQAYRHIVNNDLVWRDGVVLKLDEAIAEITEWYEQKEIRIRISGTDKRDFLTIIIDKLDSIHETYPKELAVEKWIPCLCSECKKSKTPYFYRYENLRRRLKKGKKLVECEDSFEMIPVKKLIDDFVSQDSEHKYLKDKLANGEIKEVLDIIAQKCKGDSFKEKEIILQTSRFEKFEKAKRLGTEASDKLDIEERNIYMGILNFIEKLD